VSAAAAVGNWGIVGHAEAVRHLQITAASGHPAHAYLITGPEGVGRTTLALTFARALNCLAAPELRPCGVCDSCRRISADAEHRSHSDVTVADFEWQAAVIGGPRGDRSRQRQRLSIEAVRWLRQDIVTRPVLGRWKIQIIDGADQFSDVAPDAFLKTLEEPPPYAVITLIAASADAVSETVRSRCRHIALGLVSRPEIEAALVEHPVPPERAATIARAARGRVAWALRIAADPDEWRRRAERINTAFEQLTTPLGRLRVTGAVATNYSRQRDQTLELIELYTGLWRDALLYRAGVVERTAYPEVGAELAAYAGQFELPALQRALWASQRCLSDLNANIQARVALQAMVMQWP
jgi:DNA polymerase-3 subunit delta'